MPRLLPRHRPRRLLARGNHGLAARLFAPLILHARCPVRREQQELQSLTLTPPSSKTSPPSVKKLPARVPAASATQTGVDTSHFRERVASARRAGAGSQRTQNAEARADGRKRGRGRPQWKVGQPIRAPGSAARTGVTQESRLQSLESPEDRIPSTFSDKESKGYHMGK